MTAEQLDAAIRAATVRRDSAALAVHYASAAEMTPNEEAAAFLRTQAYIFALEAGHPFAHALFVRLRRDGREK